MSSTVPNYTSMPPPASTIYHTSATAQIRDTIRPWSSFFALSLPIDFSEALYRIRKNLYNFRGNYTNILLVILFLSLLYHPVSIIVFFITFVAWLYLYFFREEPLIVFSWVIDDWMVLGFLSLVTILALILTSVWWNVFVSGIIGAAVVCIHGSFRAPDDVDMESPYGALLSVVDDDGSPEGAYTRV